VSLTVFDDPDLDPAEARPRMRYADSIPMANTDPGREPRRPFTSSEVSRMLEVGILEEGSGVELLEGDLVVMSPQDARHSGLTDVIRARLEAAVGARHYARTHSPVDAGAYSQPEPDVALVRGRAEDYVARHPTAEDTLLLVEVARSSLPRDRKKARVYAKAGFAEYWLFDIEARTAEVHREPDGVGGYRSRVTLTEAHRLAIPESERKLDLGGLFALLP
jgi:Uma2 family endonuclease